MTKEEMLSSIYDEMADKTLSDGCLIFLKEVPKDIFPYGPCFFFIRRYIDDYQIIGHPVRIGDVLDFFDKIIFRVESEEALEILPKYKLQVKSQMIEKWKRKRLPIDDQSEECIDFVYSLITK